MASEAVTPRERVLYTLWYWIDMQVGASRLALPCQTAISTRAVSSIERATRTTGRTPTHRSAYRMVSW